MDLPDWKAPGAGRGQRASAHPTCEVRRRRIFAPVRPFDTAPGHVIEAAKGIFPLLCAATGAMTAQFDQGQSRSEPGLSPHRCLLPVFAFPGPYPISD
jgi:hypothetical protein